MTILFDSAACVKSARNFGLGLSPARRERRAPYTAADREWAAAHLNENATDYEVIEPARDWDQEAGEAEAQARLDAGIPLF